MEADAVEYYRIPDPSQLSFIAHDEMQTWPQNEWMARNHAGPSNKAKDDDGVFVSSGEEKSKRESLINEDSDYGTK